MRAFLAKTFLDPAKRNVPFLMALGGLLMVFTGAIFGEAIESVVFIPRGTGDALQKVGGAILGGGVFAVIMKSAQFSEFFQKCLGDVFYSPGSTVSLPLLKEKWGVLTRALLKDTLPASYHDAAEVIRGKFLDNELEHHFEKYEVTYDFHLDADGKTLNVRHLVRTEVVISPRFESTVISQPNFMEGAMKLVSLVVDGVSLDLTDQKYLSQNPNNPKERVFSIKLSPSKLTSAEVDRKVGFERIYELQQDISVEPYFIVNFTRYIKGCLVQYRGRNCQVYFRETGLNASKYPEPTVDGEGFSRLIMADRNTLLLPGQGYILIVTATNSLEVPT